MDNEKEIKKLTNLIFLILEAAGSKLTEKEKEILFSKKKPEELKNLNAEQKKNLEDFYGNLNKGYMLLAIK